MDNKFSKNINRQIAFAKNSKAEYRKPSKKAIKNHKRRLEIEDRQNDKNQWDALEE